MVEWVISQNALEKAKEREGMQCELKDTIGSSSWSSWGKY